jgi:hypothetical protein
MKTEHVIYLSSDGCALWSWQRTQFVASPTRVGLGAHTGPLAEALRRLEPGRIAVLVDMVDEEHVWDTVPRLGRRDQQAILQRKLGRVYPRTAFRTALVQGRSEQNADEDRVLLSALTRPDPVTALLRTLADAKLPVAGVFSPALLTGHLLDARARAAPAVLLVLRRSNGRVQHSFFRHGKLAGSRRVRAQVASNEAALMHRQMEESLRYFDPTFSVGPDNPLQVVLSSADADFLRSAEADADGWQPRLLDVEGLRQRFRIATHGVDVESERLFIELLRAHAPAASFATAADLRYSELFRIRNYAKVACGVLTAAAVAGTMHNALYILDAQRQLAEETRTAQELQALLPGTRDESIAGVDPLEMQQVVSAYDALERHRAAPERILATIGSALSLRPRIQVDAIQWTVSGHDGAMDDAVDDEADEAAAPAAGGDEVIVTLRGTISPFDGDYPLAFSELALFRDVLRRHPAVESVTTLAQPLDISSSSTLSGELAEGRSEGSAPFILQVTMRVDDEPV